MVNDPSGRGKDETSYAVIKYLHGRLFLLDAGGFRGGGIWSFPKHMPNYTLVYP